MAITGRIRVALTGLLAVSLAACSAGDEVSEMDPPAEPASPATDGTLVATPASEPEIEPAPVAPEPGSAAPVLPQSTPPDQRGRTVDTLSGSEPRPPCGGSSTCVHAGSISGGHGAPGIDVHYDPERNDAITRWGNALGDLIACADSGNTITACVAEAPFEQSCKDEFERLSHLADELAAFDAVFLTAGSPCRPEEGQP